MNSFISFICRNFKLFAALITLLFVFYALFIVISNSGWPYNHEWWAFCNRIRIYTLHYKQFDFFPIWSINDGYGMGSPLPLYYHKLFYFIGGAIYLISGQMKVTLIITIAIFMIAGIFGLYKTFRLLGLNRLLAQCISLSYIFLNYTITNWFIRGAMAEFSAMMMLPFLFFWGIDSINAQKFKFSIIIIFVLLYLAHSVIAYYSLFIIFFIIILLIKATNKEAIFTMLKRCSISAIAIFSILSIYIIPMLLLRNNFNISKITNASFLPKYQFLPFGKYFWDTEFTWLKDWGPMTVQLDSSVLVAILVASAIYLYKSKKHKCFDLQNNISLILLSGLNLFYLLLQCRVMNFFYELIPGASFIQFPWRLLAFIQLINLLVLALIISKLLLINLRKVAYTISLGVLGLLLLNYPLHRDAEFNWFSDEFIENKQLEYGTFGIGEYMPNIAHIPADSIERVKDYFNELHKQSIVVKSGKCQITPMHSTNTEQLSIRYHIRCYKTAVVAWPYNYSGLEVIKTDTPQNMIPDWYRTANDTRIHTILPAGDYNLIIRFPTLRNIFM